LSVVRILASDRLYELGSLLTCVIEPGRHAECLQFLGRRGTDEPAELGSRQWLGRQPFLQVFPGDEDRHAVVDATDELVRVRGEDRAGVKRGRRLVVSRPPPFPETAHEEQP